ncbi:hypothetical protein E5D57_003135 [Metarhizium anisopliae]|nr:hypothetical protein E5D57_003135 [Metarhizium anisopliae]
MAVVQLGEWPSELIISLLDLLPLTDLLSMGRVNKYMRNVAEPLVYSAIEITWALRSTPPAMLLLPTILDRPDLASHVRTLRLQGDGFKNHPEVREPPAFPVSPLLLDKATKFIQSTGVPFAKSWIGELQLGTVDAIVAALLASMPNLTTLYLGPNFTIKSRLWGGVLRCALCQPKEYHLPTFTQLRHVTSEYRAKEWHHRDIVNTADVLPFFYLPNIEHLSVSIDNPAQFAWPSDPPAPSSIVSLDLYRLRESRLAPVLSVLRGLQKLHWNWLYQPDLDKDISKDVVELDTAAAALSYVRDTLTDLTIRAITRPRISVGDYDPPSLEIQASLDSISSFNKLMRLCVPWVFLMGFSPSLSRKILNALPLHLEFLDLAADLDDHEEWEWDDDSVLDAVRSELAGRTLSSRPHLRQITLPIPLGFGDLSSEQKKQLGDISASAGVKLAWIDK